MDSASRQKAVAFRQMHHEAEPLLLPNVWDVASAVIVEQAAFGAIATSSAGIAFSLGYPDGQKISRPEMLGCVERIVRRVKVPVTADMESGYGPRPEHAAETARGVVEAGAVGLNLEDVTGERSNPLAELSPQVEKIRAIREVAASMDVPLVLNARTDVYLLEVGSPETRYDRALERLAAFRDAGADCLFIPGLKDSATIGRFVQDLKFPVNILGGPGVPPIGELARLKVARVSLGSGVMRATLGSLRRITQELKSSGTYTLLESAPTFAEMNQLLN